MMTQYADVKVIHPVYFVKQSFSGDSESSGDKGGK